MNNSIFLMRVSHVETLSVNCVPLVLMEIVFQKMTCFQENIFWKTDLFSGVCNIENALENIFQCFVCVENQ